MEIKIERETVIVSEEADTEEIWKLTIERFQADYKSLEEIKNILNLLLK